LRKGVDKTKDKEGKEVYGIMKKVERSEREGERERKRGVCMADREGKGLVG
jgi:rRNA processing protein Gar1